MSTVPLQYVGPFDEVTITTAGPTGNVVEILVAQGEPFDAPDWLAPRLLEQPANWAAVTPSKKKSTTGDGENGATP